MKHLVTWHMMQSAIVTVSYYDENSKLWLHWERFLLNVSILCFWRWMLYNPSTDKIDCFKLNVSKFKTQQILKCWNIDYDQVYNEMSRWQSCRCWMWYKLYCYMLLCYIQLQLFLSDITQYQFCDSISMSPSHHHQNSLQLQN